ncbi:hypothetical protein [Deinococcus aquiradiocola]|uniref:Uncharacterized protein n=1 Tax=Deinococcus aquiradiocola TaxID=393059 RepID=A0A917PFK3_9DEIO|nr:hypothetical protein [Deinococcus aquiradiocola]GGJ75111.1 hypothetical protein GCM10008939_19260 [Deinococcus aquiradiocola]
MNEHPLQGTITDVVPLGHRLLLSVRGLGGRPALPTDAQVIQTGERLRLLDQPHSPTLWLHGEVTLLAEPHGETNWRTWTGKTLAVAEVEEP